MFNGCLFIQRGRLCTELCWKVREFPSIILSLISPARHSYIFIRHQSWRRDLDLPRPQSCCVRGGGNRHKNEYSKVHALLARFIDREEADFQDLATSESTNTFAFGRPNFWRLLLLDHHSTVMSEFEGDEFFFISRLLYLLTDAAFTEVAALFLFIVDYWNTLLCLPCAFGEQLELWLLVPERLISSAILSSGSFIFILCP